MLFIINTVSILFTDIYLHTYATLLAAIDIIIEISLIAWLIGSSDPWVIYYLTARDNYKFYDLLTSEKLFIDAGGEYKPVHK